MLVPSPPMHLETIAGGEWSRLAEELVSRGLWDEATAALLEGYAASYGRWVKAEIEIRKNGEVVNLPGKDKPIRNPWLDVAQDALRLMRQFLSDLKVVEKRDPASYGPYRQKVEARDPGAWFATATPTPEKPRRGKLQ
ncbi:P27 family phage terminase small subunit [uncultured Thiodictyon sp.]|uniref:P27 family phage terminase small subunit n=1 Tax=uncultured Thiodictyon sp. TaxID=1846217 RepID=UPI0025E6B21A|nr:P27 family phage terminase small subunit [uncultured Thiodictyon sp.]